MRRRYRRILWATLIAGAMLVGSAPAAFAHGERAQEAFLRMRTVAWIDTTYSRTTVRQGETFTITGTAKILDAWPTRHCGSWPPTRPLMPASLPNTTGCAAPRPATYPRPPCDRWP